MHQISSQLNNLCRVIEIKIRFLKSCTRKKYTASAHTKLCMNTETSVCMWGRNLLGRLGKRKKEDISVSLGFPNSDEKKNRTLSIGIWLSGLPYHIYNVWIVFKYRDNVFVFLCFLVTVSLCTEDETKKNPHIRRIQF